ncbi:MAG: hypothetical protein ACI8XO_004626 [Verrucomicrobiales bacterium]|jgi:hypothetical protein
MKIRLPIALSLFFSSSVLSVSAIEPDAQGRLPLEVPAGGGQKFEIPSGRNITTAYFAGDPARTPIVVEFNEDASKVMLDVPKVDGDGGEVLLELAEGTTQFSDGRIVLSALDAKVDGTKAALESHPGNHRIGFWTAIDDVVSWNYKATRPGMYQVELTYSLAGSAANNAEVRVGDEKCFAQLEPTGSWYRYSNVAAGRVYIAKPGQVAISVRGAELKGGALMNLKAVTLRPSIEGAPAVQLEDGTMELDASSATVHSTLMQYERKPQKLCLGYWANPKDWASWDFAVSKPGKFKVELTQGCGKGHGGSDVEVMVAGKTLEFTVEDTGGFQKWKVRELGEVSFDEVGNYTLEVRPKNKKGVAVMDVRRIRLVPAE